MTLYETVSTDYKPKPKYALLISILVVLLATMAYATCIHQNRAVFNPKTDTLKVDTGRGMIITQQ